MEQLLPGLTSAPNLHPMVVHFPIAFWVAATGAWSWAVVRKHEDEDEDREVAPATAGGGLVVSALLARVCET